jgi:predicted TIM-barrel fold metal-dependent hydrolase
MSLEKITEFEYPVIDADLHIYEGPEIFARFLEPKYQEQLKQIPGPFSATGDAELSEYDSAFAIFSRNEQPENTEGRMKQIRGRTYRMHLESEEAWQVNLDDPEYTFPGERNANVRLWCMDQEGIDAGIVRNTLAAGVCSFDDPELTAAVCRAYNDWVHDFCSADPSRLYAEALLPCGDMDAAIAELERTAEMGFKTTVVPGSTAAPKPLSDEYWDPLWARMQELGWPLCVHATFNAALDSAAQFLLSPNKVLSSSGSAYFAMYLNLNFMLDNIVTMGEITLGGMCDKFPNLNVYFIEAGHSWVGEVLYRLDKVFACPPSDDFMPHHPLGATTKPSEIFERQIYVPFEGGDQHYMSDMSFNALSKNLIWASDIPHWDADGPWEGAGALRALKVSKEAEALIMGGNLARMLGVPHEKKVGTSRAAVPASV